MINSWVIFEQLDKERAEKNCAEVDRMKSEHFSSIYICEGNCRRMTIIANSTSQSVEGILFHFRLSSITKEQLARGSPYRL